MQHTEKEAPNAERFQGFCQLRGLDGHVGLMPLSFESGRSTPGFLHFKGLSARGVHGPVVRITVPEAQGLLVYGLGLGITVGLGP